MVFAPEKPFQYIQESNNDFLKLFPHRYDYIYARHPQLGQRPQWQTESRHPLSDRLIEQGAYLYGVRFGQQTQYTLLDIDIGSAYHPKSDPIAFQRVIEALEPLGLVASIICTSSSSQGLHLYFPFDQSLPAWEIGSAISLLLETQGFKIQPGQLEVFPNARLYPIENTPNLFNAHRLPLQQGSYVLNKNLEPTFSSQNSFAQQWQHCQQRNSINNKTLQQVLKQKKRKHYRLSNKADKFLNDLNTEIEQGWTGPGQTNRILGRITMRSYIFHHVINGGKPLTGTDLVQNIVETAKALPGFEIWCQHQYEIEHRATEWANCIEGSHYFHYGEQFGKYKAIKQPDQDITTKHLSWNQQQVQKTKAKIMDALNQLTENGQLPDQPTARFKVLQEFGIGGGSLYRYKELWHPLWNSPQTPHLEKERESSQLDCVENASNWHSSTSLLEKIGSNPNEIKDSRHFDKLQSPSEGGNPSNEAIQKIRQELVKVQEQSQKTTEKQFAESHNLLSHQPRVAKLKQIAYWLTLDDPILMAEALAWLQQQPVERCAELLDITAQENRHQALEVIIEIIQQLQHLDWTPTQIQKSLRSQFHTSSLAQLTPEQREQWLSYLQYLSG